MPSELHATGDDLGLEILGYDEEHFQRVFNGFPEGVALIGEGGVLLRVSNNYAKMFGYDSPAEVEGRKGTDLVAPESRDVGDQVIARRLRGEKVSNTEYVMLRKDGSTFYGESTASILADHTGRPAAYLAIVRDTTERHEAEAALRASEERYRDLFDGAIEGVYRSTLDGAPTTMNLGLARMLGYDSPEEALADITDAGRQVWANPSQRAAFRYLLEKTGVLHDYETEFKRRDGSLLAVSISAGLVEAEPGGDRMLQGFVIDITERKNAERELVAAEQRFELMFESAPIAISMTRGTELVYGNPAFVHLLGYDTLEQIQAMPPLYNFAPSERGKILQRVRDRASGRSVPASYESSCMREDGSTFPVWIDISQIDFPDGRATVSFIADITEPKRAMDGLAEAHGRADRLLSGLVETIGRLVEMRDPYTMGHQAGVAKIAAELGRELGYDENAVEGLRVAGVLHDVGKIAVPADILSKPGSLADYEYDIVRLHSQRGYEILEPIEFEWPIAQIVLQHHERLDGSGYPSGLTAEQILPEARILAVADTVDAMCTHRPYRQAGSLRAAVKEIVDHPECYDADVAAALKRVVHDGRIEYC